MTRGTPKIPSREIRLEELPSMIERARANALVEKDQTTIPAILETFAFVARELQSKNASLLRLRKILFGAGSEKTSVVFGEKKKSSADRESKKASGDKREGHGRNGADAYIGARRIVVEHETLKHGDSCPCGCGGHVYEQNAPAELVRVVGMAPMNAHVFECERLRCGTCGKVFTAAAPDGAGEKKYDETVPAMIAQFKYGCGVPFNRIEKLQAGFGIPLPAATQWELAAAAAVLVKAAFLELIRQAAQGKVLHNDDTTMRILEVNRVPAGEDEKAETKKRERTGIFTTGIISRGEHDIALFHTGIKHAGENLAEVILQREERLSAPIQMCDALSRNTTGDFKKLLSNCIAHGRRKFVEVVESFPEECRRVLETLRDVYHNDTIARESGMSPEERLVFHQRASGPLMADLREWFDELFEQRKVEPNSSLGEAVTYMTDHWEALTLFLREPGAPLDNNICERSLKKAILHRKNSLYYRTENGARVGDIFMSLIHTAELNKQSPFDYLVALQRHSAKVEAAPANWMPWNYRATLASFSTDSDPPR